MHVGNPVLYGGYGFEYDTVFEIAMELGRACGSTAWCYAVWQSHNWMVGNFAPEAQEDYFAGGPDTIAATAVSVVNATATPAEGGYVLSGRWNLSSGCDSASWVMVAANGIGPRQSRLMMMVPAGDVTIIDNWYVSGLRGTGSKDVVIQDVFVPARHASSLAEHHGWDIHRRPSYRLPLMTIWPYTLAAPGIGIAQGAIDEFCRKLDGKTGPGRTADSVALQLRLAESAAEVDLARLILRTDCAEMLALAADGADFPAETQSRYRRNQAFVTRLSIRAVDRLFEASGGHALYEAEAMQRFHRDVHAVGHHAALYWDSSAETYGRSLLGLPPSVGSF
jgi:3-hydroxy-9,10-secoandrosta-1,3,5(10)-triene-9,17-dione monooxygenase